MRGLTSINVDNDGIFMKKLTGRLVNMFSDCAHRRSVAEGVKGMKKVEVVNKGEECKGRVQ